MRNEKIKEFVLILAKTHVVYFYLYNAKYRVMMLPDDNYVISCYGSSINKTYHKIDNLFSNYRVYGQSLYDCIDDIKIENN